MIKAIFWDNDGVLVETEPLYYQANREALASVGVELSEAEYRELFLRQSRGAWHLAEERGLTAAEVERLREWRNTRYTELIRLEPRAIAGVEEVLAALHGRVVMGVVTSSRRDHFDAIHEGTGFLKYFDFVLALGDYARSKPHPDPYVRAIELSGVPREQCVAIEDSERGLTAALGAGLRCLVVPSPLTRYQTFAGAERILSGVREVPDAIAGLRSG